MRGLDDGGRAAVRQKRNKALTCKSSTFRPAHPSLSNAHRMPVTGPARNDDDTARLNPGRCADWSRTSSRRGPSCDAPPVSWCSSVLDARWRR
jgi:hypothetical protein